MKGPNVKKAVAEHAALSRAEQTLEEIRGVLQHNYGVSIPAAVSPPENIEDFDKIDAMSNQQLGNLHAMLVGYAATLGYRVAEAKVVENESKRTHDEHKAMKSAEFSAQGVPKSEIDDRVKIDETTQRLATDYYKHKYIRDLLQARHEGFVSQAAAVSRIITIRTTEIENNMRDGRLGNRGRSPFGNSGGRPQGLRPGPGSGQRG